MGGSRLEWAWIHVTETTLTKEGLMQGKVAPWYHTEHFLWQKSDWSTLGHPVRCQCESRITDSCKIQTMLAIGGSQKHMVNLNTVSTWTFDTRMTLWSVIIGHWWLHDTDMTATTVRRLSCLSSPGDPGGGRYPWVFRLSLAGFFKSSPGFWKKNKSESQASGARWLQG